ncbi:MAG: triose-phosphate isomerase [Thermodesulfobacteriota bacterium]
MKKKDRRPWIGGNWKMFKTVPEAREFITGLIPALPHPLETDVVIAPPFTALNTSSQELQGSPVQLAAQNVHWAEEGAFTGEISVRMLKDMGCTYSLIGHSERRHVFGETDDQVRKKVMACLQGGLKPVLCVGETLPERDAGQIQEVIRRQIRVGLQGISEADLTGIIIAYEPVWAIGTGRSATPAAAQEVHAFIRGLLVEGFNKTLAMGTRIVYGGSVTPDNIRDLYVQKDIDGALVGGASLKIEKFLPLIREVNQ